jgi:hypothetical protein
MTDESAGPVLAVRVTVVGPIIPAAKVMVFVLVGMFTGQDAATDAEPVAVTYGVALEYPRIS